MRIVIRRPFLPFFLGTSFKSHLVISVDQDIQGSLRVMHVVCCWGTPGSPRPGSTAGQEASPRRHQREDPSRSSVWTWRGGSRASWWWWWPACAPPSPSRSPAPPAGPPASAEAPPSSWWQILQNCLPCLETHCCHFCLLSHQQSAILWYICIMMMFEENITEDKR